MIKVICTKLCLNNKSLLNNETLNAFFSIIIIAVMFV